MGFITEESKLKVLAACDIVDIVGSYFPLKRAGTSYKACCPFHAERTPSFHVNPVRNTFHCFGCGKGGDGLRFVMDYENLPFPDALKKLAAKYGITVIEEAGSAGQEENASRRVSMLALHRDIAAWFHQLLLRAEPAAAARSYLKNRGLNAETAKRWVIGYAPAEAGWYQQFAREKGYTSDDLTESGFYFGDEPDRPRRGDYPRFRHRIMFPIRNDHGDIIAFSGRILDADSSPAKYMNSPETPIFKKSDVFFGFDKSKRAIHKAQNAIICEGQIDMIMCFESGIENIVAPLGTAFTENHAHLLRRHTDQVTLCYDSDGAGVKAAQSAFRELCKEGIFVKVAALPEGEDPDSLIRKEGVEALRERLAQARDYFDFLLDVRLPGMDTNNARDRMKLLSDLAGQLALLKDRVTIDTAVNRSAIRLGVPADELQKMLSAHVRKRSKDEEMRKLRASERPDFGQEPDFEDPVRDESGPLVIDNQAVRLLLRLALTDATAAQFLRTSPEAGLWRALVGGDLLDKALAAGLDPAQDIAVTAWLSSLSGPEQAAITGILHENIPNGPAAADTARQAVLHLKLQAVTSLISVRNSQMRQNGQTPETLLAVTAEIMTLGREKAELQASLRNFTDLR